MASPWQRIMIAKTRSTNDNRAEELGFTHKQFLYKNGVHYYTIYAICKDGAYKDFTVFSRSGEMAIYPHINCSTIGCDNAVGRDPITMEPYVSNDNRRVCEKCYSGCIDYKYREDTAVSVQPAAKVADGVQCDIASHSDDNTSSNDNMSSNNNSAIIEAATNGNLAVLEAIVKASSDNHKPLDESDPAQRHIIHKYKFTHYEMVDGQLTFTSLINGEYVNNTVISSGKLIVFPFRLCAKGGSSCLAARNPFTLEPYKTIKGEFVCEGHRSSDSTPISSDNPTDALAVKFGFTHVKQDRHERVYHVKSGGYLSKASLVENDTVYYHPVRFCHYCHRAATRDPKTLEPHKSDGEHTCAEHAKE